MFACAALLKIKFKFKFIIEGLNINFSKESIEKRIKNVQCYSRNRCTTDHQRIDALKPILDPES